MAETIVFSGGMPADEDPEALDSRYEEEFLAKARDRFNATVEAEAENRKAFLEDLEFYDGNQWPDDIKHQREHIDHRPCLTINRLPGLVHAVSNEIRQNKPAPKVSPVDDAGDKETAEVFQGIIRYIERQSNAPAVRSYASFYSIVTGLSYYRITTEYARGSANRDQEIYIRRIRNPLVVYMDQSCKEPDCCDANFCFVVDDLTEDKFKDLYPNAKVSSLEDYRSTGDGSAIWGDGNTIRVCDYFTVETVREPVVQLGDGSWVPLEQAPQGVPVLEKRTDEKRIVIWSRITGAEIIEQRQWPGYYIPVVRMIGEEYEIDGKTKLVGMVRHAKDPQRMLNYWESAKTETIALAPRVPYIAAEGQIENHEQEWAQANSRNWAVLTYKPREVGGSPVPPPQRQVYEPPIQAISMAEGGAIDNLKATTGVYDPSLGNRSNETSGIAIRQRLMQGSTANYHFIDNVTTAITHEARILIDLIPKIYDRPGRVMRIIGEDGSEKEVKIGAPEDAAQGGKWQDRRGNLQRLYALGTARYDVAVDVGPSYQTKRQESVESMTAFAQAAPQLVPQYADLYVQAMDWPNADQIAERVRPPGIPADDQPPVPPQVAMQMQQLTQQNQELQATVEQMQQVILGKQTEMQSRERIAVQDNQTKLQIAQMQAQLDMLIKRMDTGSKEQLAGLGAMTQRGMQSRDLTNEAMRQDEDLRSKEAMKHAELDSREAIAQYNAQVKLTAEEMKARNATQGTTRPD